jgi:hypothetical protein
VCVSPEGASRHAGESRASGWSFAVWMKFDRGQN